MTSHSDLVILASVLPRNLPCCHRTIKFHPAIFPLIRSGGKLRLSADPFIGCPAIFIQLRGGAFSCNFSSSFCRKLSYRTSSASMIRRAKQDPPREFEGRVSLFYMPSCLCAASAHVQHCDLNPTLPCTPPSPAETFWSPEINRPSSHMSTTIRDEALLRGFLHRGGSSLLWRRRSSSPIISKCFDYPRSRVRCFKGLADMSSSFFNRSLIGLSLFLHAAF